MKSPNARGRLMDLVLVVSLTVVAVFFLPSLSAWCAAVSLHLGRTLFWVHSIALGHLLPHLVIGGLLGFIAACLVRHRKLSVALLPSVLLCLFYVLYLSFGPYPYPWGQSRQDLVLIASWLLLVITSFLCARWILGRRSA